MRVLVMGARGMAGHVLVDVLRSRTGCEVWASVRGPVDDAHSIDLDVTDELATCAVLNRLQPDVVVNAVGILNAQAEADSLAAIRVNSLLPRWLAYQSRKFGFRLIHISTDCVFSGQTGGYRESDSPDGTTMYARTKALGEVTEAPHLTIRTSIIGPELKANGIGLFHWFMRQHRPVHGYRNVYWNGVTTLTLSQVIAACLEQHVSGLVHLTGLEVISKYTLLTLLRNAFQKTDVEILPTESIPSNKSLVNTRSDFSPVVPSYPVMLAELRAWMDTESGRKYPYA